jgi:hypothetical protein
MMQVTSTVTGRTVAGRTVAGVDIATLDEDRVIDGDLRRFGDAPGDQQHRPEKCDQDCSRDGRDRHLPFAGHTAPMGFDPNRKHRSSPFDFWFVGAAFVVVIGLVVWAALG